MWQDFSWDTQYTYLHTPNRKPMTDKTTDSKSNMMMEWVWGYVLKYDWGVSCRGRNDSRIALPRPTPAQVGLHRSWNWEPGALCTVCRQLNRWKSILSKWLSCSQLLLGSSAFASSQLLALAQFYLRMGQSESLLWRLACVRTSSLLYSLRREGPSESGRFHWLLESILSEYF